MKSELHQLIIQNSLTTSSDDDEDDELALMMELEKIKRERAEQRAKEVWSPRL